MGGFAIHAVGDVAACRADMASMFAGVRSALAAPVVFGQLEAVVSDRGEIVPQAKLAMRAPPALAGAVAEARFTMMSCAGNHCLDWGTTAFRDTLAHGRAAGLLLAGGGETLDEAWTPAIQFHDGVRVALVAANAILPEGYGARPDRPGCAPLRAYTLYEQIEHDQPGTPARVRTVADRADLARLVAAISAARAAADIVLVSLHWGIHMVRGTIADYQVEVGHAAIEAGADAILGHHPHIMKGIGFHRGRPIFYSLGNFAIEQPHVFDPAIVDTDSFRHLVSLNPRWSMGAAYMLPEETRITGIARLIVADGGVAAVRFRPCWIGDDSAPRPLDVADPRFEQVRAYLAEVTASEGLATRIAVAGDELVFSPG